MTENERINLLRSVPEPRERAFTPEEAIDTAKAAFHAARRAQAEVLAAYLTQMLFDSRTVTWGRLRGLQNEARKQVELAQRVEQLIGDAVEAFEATRHLPPAVGRTTTDNTHKGANNE